MEQITINCMFCPYCQLKFKRNKVLNIIWCISFVEAQVPHGIVLVCMILEHMLDSTDQHCVHLNNMFAKYQHERYLMIGEQEKIKFENLLPVLKQLLILTDKGRWEVRRLNPVVFR